MWGGVDVIALKIIKKGAGAMIRGTTAQFKFKLPYSKEELEWIRIKFWQPNNQSELLPITKVKGNCATTDNQNEICVSLTAEETARFSDRYKAKVQLRAQPLGGTVFGSQQQLFTVYPMLDEIIEDDPTVEPSTPEEEGWIILDGETVTD